MSTRQDPILRSVRARADERLAGRTAADLRRELEPRPADGARALAAGLRAGASRDGLGVIAECKRRSPSAGTLSGEIDLAARARAYAAGGAHALSVLTEADHFGGAPRDLARTAVAGLPRLRKDFLLDERMVLESALLGADAVLLLAVCLEGTLLAELRGLAREVGLGVLVEVHDEHELERALAVDPDCLGINARDLRTFQVDLATVERLLPRVPPGPLRVAESGIRGEAELLRVRAAGAEAVLVGEALMRAGDPRTTLAGWFAALAGQETRHDR